MSESLKTGNINIGKCNWLFIIAMFLFLFFSCKDEHPVIENCFDGIQNQNEAGIDCGGICMDCKLHPKMAAKINGVAWTADTTNLSASYTTANSQLQINGRTKSTFYPAISLIYLGSLTPGTYSLNSSTSYAKDISSFITFTSGTITFNNVDTQDRLLNGSFSFTCSDQSGTTYSISEGVFEDIEY